MYYAYAILRVFGEKVERQKFIDYASKIVPPKSEDLFPPNIYGKMPALMDIWYDFETWENEKGTFVTFYTPILPILKSNGYKLHKLFPSLEFIYRSINEGFPNQCGKWEFSPNDPPSEKTEKDLEILGWLRVITHQFLVANPGDVLQLFQEYIAEKCNHDRAEIARIADLYQKMPTIEKYFDDSKNMTIISDSPVKNWSIRLEFLNAQRNGNTGKNVLVVKIIISTIFSIKKFD